MFNQPIATDWNFAILSPGIPIEFDSTLQLASASPYNEGALMREESNHVGAIKAFLC
jgi:hypothetical protein